MFLNVKSSKYYFHMTMKILADFQICISVPLRTEVQLVFPERLRFRLVSFVKDTHREKALSSKTPVLTKSRDMSIYVVGLHQVICP